MSTSRQSNAQQFSLFSLLLLALASTTSACTCTHAPTVDNSLTHYPVAIKVWVGADVSPPVAPCPAYSFCPGSMFRNQYLDSFVDVTFKEEDASGSRGKLIVKNRGFCGAGLQPNTNMLLFGTITEESVEGYFGTIPVFTPSPCGANQAWEEISEADQTTIMDYEDAN